MSGYDLVVAGGGPAGATVALYAARGDLDVLVADRGASSLGHCAFLANYPGFPAGIDVPTFRACLRAGLEHAGADRVPGEVVAVERADGAFRVETRERGAFAADRVVAATKYDAAYLDPLGGDEWLASDPVTGASVLEAVDREGRLPVDGVYAAGAMAGCPDQVVAAAGHGMRVARAVLVDAREDRGHWPAVAEQYYDWTTRAAAHDEGWEARVADWVESTLPADRDVADERVARVVDRAVAREAARAITREEAAERRREAHLALLEYLDDDAIREYVACGDGDEPEPT